MSYFIIYWKKKNSIAMCGFYARTDTVVYPFKLHLTMVLKYDEEIKVDSNFHERFSSSYLLPGSEPRR